MQQQAEKVVKTMLEKDAYSRWLGIELVKIAPGTAVVRMKVRGEMLNGFGVCHGGITYALADSAFAFAANTQGRISMSIQNSISYTRQVQLDDLLTASAVESSPGDKIAVYDVIVTNQRNEEVALFRGTVYRTSKELIAHA
ncbi:MAG: hydroxyphenylacetyl-CoA thioesterase PaaI [Oligoflexia bacterium]|nr:hydroxyphenylacetyl-CoA thioesterase PaaI [Oligoflexia bacterium]